MVPRLKALLGGDAEIERLQREVEEAKAQLRDDMTEDERAEALKNINSASNALSKAQGADKVVGARPLFLCVWHYHLDLCVWRHHPELDTFLCDMRSAPAEYHRGAAEAE